MLASPDKRAVLFANGESKCLQALELHLDDYLVAVDGGLNALQTLGQSPHLLVGDLDSISPEQLHACEAAGVEILRFPPAKDLADLELALETLVQRGFRQAVIANGLGGRLDHSLGNLSLLAAPAYASLDLTFDDGCTTVRLLRGPAEATLSTQVNDLISLIAWQGEAHGLCTSGLQYPLNNETLYPWQARGISNLATSQRAQIQLKDGQVLLVHTRKTAERQP